MISLALQNYDNKDYIMSDKDNEFFAKYLNSNKNIKKYILANHHIKLKSRHIHVLLYYDKIPILDFNDNVVDLSKEQRQHITKYKNNLRKLIKNYFKPYNIPSHNRCWLKITHIKKYTYNSAYLHYESDDIIVYNCSDYDDTQLNLELLQYHKNKKNKELKKFRVLNKRNAWPFIHNFINKRNIKIEKYEDIQYLEKTLFYSGIYINYPSSKLFNDIFLFYTKDKDLEHNIISERSYLTKDEIKDIHNNLQYINDI